MQTPKYVIELMKQARYNYDKADYCVVGYTIDIEKSSQRQLIQTHLNDIEKLKAFVERNGGELIINRIPTKTRYAYQAITVTIFDPVMKHLETYIPKEIRRV